MEFQLVQKGLLEYTRKRKKFLLLLAAFGISSYGVYRFYNLPSIVKKRKKFFKLIGTLISLIEVVSESSETIGVVSKDLKEFLQSDSDEIPNSLKQIAKITRSQEFSESLVKVTEALTLGILKGYNKNSNSGGSSEKGDSSSFSDQLLDKLFSTAGTGFASVVVGNFARSLVMAFYSEQSHQASEEKERLMRLGSSSSAMPEWVSVICSDKCKDMIADCIQSFVSTAVAVYLDKTMNINTYDDIFSGLTNPKHGTKVKDVLVSVCNGAVETLIKTSHQVMTNANSNLLNLSISSSSSPIDLDQGGGLCAVKDVGFEPEYSSTTFKARNSTDGNKENGWFNQVSSALAVPNNRSFVLDVTGRVTFETVRSFLDFVLWRMVDGLRRSCTVIREEVVERGLEVFRYISAKSAAIVTLCFAFCLHLVGGYRMLMPAYPVM
ncbi:Phloem protein 2-like a10 [Thalictrum thalictroides]|uniref:Phloem protein 2-like a10 n=1 Tax=Thalictrum thalictroides TaxID=46969 RepID=A0A7J6V8C2_THATH|nr:Phloem protein 2-like a10 [Thalictrum thalictroides]